MRIGQGRAFPPLFVGGAVWIMYDSRKDIGTMVFYGKTGWKESPDDCEPWTDYHPPVPWTGLIVITLDEARAIYTLRSL